MFNFKLSVAAAALALAGAAHADVVDGNFAGGATVGQYHTYGAGETIDGAWLVNSGTVDLIGTYWTQPSATTWSVDMDGSSAGAISQDLTLAAGGYKLTFLLAANPDGGSPTKYLDVSIGDRLAHLSVSSAGKNDQNMGFSEETLYFHVDPASVGQTLSFASKDGASYNGAAIADVSIVAVPEPTSVALLLAGLGMVGVMASRRRGR